MLWSTYICPAGPIRIEVKFEFQKEIKMKNQIIEFRTAGSVVFGNNAIEQVEDIIGKMKAGRILYMEFVEISDREAISQRLF